MKKTHHLGIFGIFCGSLFVAPLAVLAQITPTPNPCPLIYYEEPWNRILAVPQGCPPNEAGQAPEGVYTRPQIPADSPLQPAQPGPRTDPLATVVPRNGLVDVKINNITDVPVFYEALGYSERRSLPSGEQGVLRNVPVPVMIAIIREDEGLIGIIPVSSREGLLELTLNEDPTINRIYGIIKINSDGEVSL